jgi:FlaA1/EpsC-like NDP-sugar epimerase
MLSTYGLVNALIIANMITLPIFYVFGLYRIILRHEGWMAMSKIVHVSFLAAIPMVGIVTMIGVPDVPRAVGILAPLLLFFLIGTSRVSIWLYLSGLFVKSLKRSDQTKVLVYGAGSAGRQLVAALKGDRQFDIIGYIDDSRALQGRSLGGIPIWAADCIEKLVVDGIVNEVLLAIPSASRKRRQEIIANIRKIPAQVQTLPALADLARDKIQLSDLRHVEVADLLGRDPVLPNTILLSKNIACKSVMVTGAGGSIGAELCRQIFDRAPSALYLVESNEFALYTIYEELKQRPSQFGNQVPVLVALLGSVRDEALMDEMLHIWKPTTIYHAAAYKHVPLVEHNVIEGLRNNIWGTLTMARAAIRHGVADFVLISTDKAVRPTNVMGTSKRLAELVLQALAAEQGGTRFSMVRFGNVLDSSGSIVPLFRKQILAGGPLTITHQDVTRYFMTIPEAAQLVIQAGAMAAGGEVFVLDMGESVRIAQLARDMIELSGYTVCDEHNPDGDIKIVVVGLRPGEKLYEELLIGNNAEKTRHSRIMKANEQMVAWPILERQLGLLAASLNCSDISNVRSLLCKMVPEYRPDGVVVDWAEVERKVASA